MKTLILVLVILSAVLLGSTLICGLWIEVNNVTEVSSIKFHSTVAIMSVVTTIITFVVMWIKLKRVYLKKQIKICLLHTSIGCRYIFAVQEDRYLVWKKVILK